jgi:hypothetical protein
VSGRRQHHIPQMLLRGFRREANGIDRIYTFTRTKPPYLTPVTNTAEQRHFYSAPATDGTATLDDTITEYETRLGQLLGVVRDAAPNETIDADIAAELVAHLTIRNAHVRTSLTEGMQVFAVRLFGIFSDPNQARELIGLTGATPNTRFREVAMEAVKKQLGALKLPDPVLERVAFVFAQENFSTEFEKAEPKIKGALALLFGEVACTRFG